MNAPAPLTINDLFSGDKMSRFVLGFILVYLASSGGALAQNVMDGSQKKIPKKDLQLTMSWIGKSLLDPYGAQLRSLRKSGEAVCGEINIKTDSGYAGFKPFYYDLQLSKGMAVTDIDRPTGIAKRDVASHCD